MICKLCFLVFAVMLFASGCKGKKIEAFPKKDHSDIFVLICKKYLEKIGSTTENLTFSVSEPIPFSEVRNRISMSESFFVRQMELMDDDLYRICTYGPKLSEITLGGVGVFVINERLQATVYRELGR